MLDTRRFIQVVHSMTISQMKARYRQTFAGFLWVIINPIVMFGVQAVIFKHVLKIEIQNYFLFLLGGLLPWVFMTSSMMMTANTFVSSRGLLQSFKLNPLVLVASVVFDNFFNFVVTLGLLVLGATFFASLNYMGIIMLPFALILLLVVVSILSILIATMQVFFRDTMYVNQFFINIMYFLTPIFYPVELVPENLRVFVYLNPYYIVVEPFQICIYRFEMLALLISLLKLIGLIVLLSFITARFWTRKNNEFYLRL